MLENWGSESTVRFLRNVVPDDEHTRLVGWILNDRFLLSNPGKEEGALTARDLLFSPLSAISTANCPISSMFQSFGTSQGVLGTEV
jgi:hypothetical protein